MKKCLVILGILTFTSCKNFDDAVPAQRDSFIHFYGSTLNYEGVKAEIDLDGGFVIIGNVKKGDIDRDLIVIKTDKDGKQLWEKVFQSSSASDIMVVSDGYMITGDSIDYHPKADRISEILNTSARLLKLDMSGITKFDLSIKDTIKLADGTIGQVDYHGSAVTLDANKNIILLGSSKSPLSSGYEKSFISGIASDFKKASWTQRFDLENKDYINNNSIHLTSNNNFLYSTTAYLSKQALSNAYVSVVYAGTNTVFKNNDRYGENSDHNHTASDMQRSGVGYGVIGTYANNTGQNSNIFFARVDEQGTIMKDRVQYFDGEKQLELANINSSETQDTGSAITGTREGDFVLAGSFLTTPDKGNGANDILLIKVDAFGNYVWSKTLGGSGDEVVNSIRETSDGGFLVCGTNTVNGLSSIFIMKTDKNGELKN